MNSMTETPKRRSCDHYVCDGHNSPCDHLNQYVDFQEVIRLDLEEIKSDLKAVKELLDAWKNMKGFIRTMQIIGSVAKWITVTGAAFAAIWYWLHGGKQ